MMMLITASFALVCQSFVFAQNECDFASNCNIDKNIAHVQCVKLNSEDADCKCLDPDGNQLPDCAYGGALTGLDDLLNFDEFDLDNSIEKCTENTGASPPCNFYKFIHVETGPMEIKDLYLMTECTHGDVGCDAPTCFSGGIHCDGDHTSTEKPGGAGCMTTGEYHPSSMEDYYLHWYCTHPNPEVDTPNFVDDAGGMPIGTVCTAHHKCWRYSDTGSRVKKTFVDPIDSYQLKYACNADPTGDGKWESAHGTTAFNSLVMEDGVKLNEVTCNADDLVLDADNFNQEGLLITCTSGDVFLDGNVPTVPAENHCLLLCDMYPILSFFVDWKQYDTLEDNIGERVWYYQYQIAGQERHELPNPDTSIIKCWP